MKNSCASGWLSLMVFGAPFLVNAWTPATPGLEADIMSPKSQHQLRSSVRLTEPSPTTPLSRRYVFEQVVSAGLFASFLLPAANPLPSYAEDATTTTAIVGCSTPESMCTTAEKSESDTNAFITRLKQQSEAKKVEYQQQSQTRDKLSSQQFKSQYQRPKYIGIQLKGREGSFQMATPEELKTFLKEGKVELQYGTKGGGAAIDYSKKIYVFTE